MKLEKKTYEPPKVLALLDVCLEADLLAGPSSISMIILEGQQIEDGYTPYTDENIFWD